MTTLVGNMSFLFLLFSCFFTGALFQGVFLPNGSEEVPSGMKSGYFNVYELYREKVAAFDALEYEEMKYSLYEECRTELLESSIDI